MFIRGGAVKVRGRVLAGVLVAVTALLVGAAPASGQEAPAADEVTIDDSFGVGSLIDRGCDGDEQLFPGFAAVILARSAIGGGVSTSDLSVGVTFSGTEASNLVDPPSEIELLAGEDLGGAGIDLLTPGTGSLTITVEPGAGYVLTEPSTVTVDLSGSEVANDCTAPITSGGDAEQTIEVGSQPEGFFPLVEDSILGGALCVDVELVDGSGGFSYCIVDAPGEDLFDMFLETPVVGTLPPGLAYADDRWSGAATTPGVYPLQVRLCEDPGDFADDDLAGVIDEGVAPEGDEVRDRVARRSLGRAAVRAGEEGLLCAGTLDVEITVVPVAAAPAVPVRAPARFTG